MENGKWIIENYGVRKAHELKSSRRDTKILNFPFSIFNYFVKTS